MDDSGDFADRHRRVCKIFGDEVSAVGDHWQTRSPCGEWDARGVLEHVIGSMTCCFSGRWEPSHNGRRAIRWAGGRPLLKPSTGY